jgi:hypothetical protein
MRYNASANCVRPSPRSIGCIEGASELDEGEGVRGANTEKVLLAPFASLSNRS